jgi:hypothetical protein
MVSASAARTCGDAAATSSSRAVSASVNVTTRLAWQRTKRQSPTRLHRIEAIGDHQRLQRGARRLGLARHVAPDEPMEPDTS